MRHLKFKFDVTKVSLLWYKSFNFAVLKIANTILSFLLTVTILSNSLHVSFTYAYYFLDTSDFIERFCENKDKPELQCDGKCHLKNVVKNDSADNDKIPFKDINLKEITLFVVNQLSYNIFSLSIKETQLLNYNNLYGYSFISSLDHPPQV